MSDAASANEKGAYNALATVPERADADSTGRWASSNELGYEFG